MITHKGTQTIHTERLILRKFTIDDAQAMFENWASDEKVTRYLTWCRCGLLLTEPFRRQSRRLRRGR